MPTETQSSIYSWMNATFPGVDPDSPRKSIRLLEECVELCLASGASCDEIMEAVAKVIFVERGPDYRKDLTFEEVKAGHFPEYEKVPSEAADVLIVLYGIAGMRGFDLHDQVDIKMKTNRGRRWRAMGDGTGYHVPQDEIKS